MKKLYGLLLGLSIIVFNSYGQESEKGSFTLDYYIQYLASAQSALESYVDINWDYPENVDIFIRFWSDYLKQYKTTLKGTSEKDDPFSNSWLKEESKNLKWLKKNKNNVIEFSDDKVFAFLYKEDTLAVVEKIDICLLMETFDGRHYMDRVYMINKSRINILGNQNLIDQKRESFITNVYAIVKVNKEKGNWVPLPGHRVPPLLIVYNIQKNGSVEYLCNNSTLPPIEEQPFYKDLNEYLNKIIKKKKLERIIFIIPYAAEGSVSD